MSSTAPNPDVVLAPEERPQDASHADLKRLLSSPGTLESDWEHFFTVHPFALSDNLALKVVIKNVRASDSNSRHYPDFIVYPDARISGYPYRIIEMKVPPSGKLRPIRKNILTLSENADEAIRQAETCAIDQQKEISITDNLLILGNRLHLFFVMGLTDTMREELEQKIQESPKERLSTTGVQILTQDLVSQLFNNDFPPSIIFLSPVASELPPAYTNALGMGFVLIEPGTFSMGSEHGNSDERPVHRVEITNPFYMARFPVTQGEWLAAMGDNPSHFKKGDDHPLENVNWYMFQQFIEALNEEDERYLYRLPSEAEWEYACRAGAESEYFFGNDPSHLGIYSVYGKPHLNDGHDPVGTKEPNPWGLYDMLGNIWEWVEDWYEMEYYKKSPPQDPRGPEGGLFRVVRGASYRGGAFSCRPSFRRFNLPNCPYVNCGFRLVAEPR